MPSCLCPAVSTRSDTPESTTPGMVVRWAQDAGKGPDSNVLYMLRWETLESNADMPRATILCCSYLSNVALTRAGASARTVIV